LPQHLAVEMHHPKGHHRRGHGHDAANESCNTQKTFLGARHG
jgi:hypothetical protein